MSTLAKHKQKSDKDHAGLDDRPHRVTILEDHYFMRTIQWNYKTLAIALGLSIAVMPGLVNGQAQSLTSVNQDKSTSKADLKDSVKDAKSGASQLIAAILKSGADENTGSNLASAIGLPKSMPTKVHKISMSTSGKGLERRECFVVYEKIESAATLTSDNRAVCAYIVKSKLSDLVKQTRFFRIDLNGRLEKVVLIQSKADESGKIVRGSGVKTDQDIDSPEVRETFEEEMKFWLKDWLKKEQKNAAKTADAAKPSPAAPAL